MRFSWDQDKALRNKAKHGVAFAEAASVFWDDKARFMEDPDHSIEEERYLLLGFSNMGRLLVVCHTERMNGDEIRIISARLATRREMKMYGEFL